MADLIFIAIAAVFFALTLAYVVGCEHLHGPPGHPQ